MEYKSFFSNACRDLDNWRQFGGCDFNPWSYLVFILWLGAPLTHWRRVTHICVVKLTIIGSDNGLSPERRQAIIWTNAGILLVGPLGTNFSEILIEIQTFSLKKIRLKMSSAKCCSFRLGLNVLTSIDCSGIRLRTRIGNYTHITHWSSNFNDGRWNHGMDE